jgi:AF2212-like protein
LKSGNWKLEIRNSKFETRPEKSGGQTGPLEHAAARTIRARYSGGMLVPAEPLDLPEGAEITLTIKPVGSRKE